MTAANTLPTRAQMMPAVTPPMSAARNFTPVLGMNAYMNVNTAVTMRYGTISPSTPKISASGATAFTARATQKGPQSHDGKVFGEAAPEASCASAPPYEIETLFDLLNSGN